jgi:hypothetical protein
MTSKTKNNKYHTTKNKTKNRMKNTVKERKKRRATREAKKVHVLKNTTPKSVQYLSTLISSEIHDASNSKANKAKGLEPRYSSYAPTINEELVSLKSITRENIRGCNNERAFELLEPIQIEIKDKDAFFGNKCVPYYDENAKDFLLRNLSANKHIDVSKIITPKQYRSNCWFNAMFVTLFISDKGRKFFHYFRQLMIVGKQTNGSKIPHKLADAFALLNFAIESCLTGSEYAYDLDTNSIIQKIYKSIPKGTRGSNTGRREQIYNVDVGGNPIHYYLSIIEYLHNTSVDLLFVHTHTNHDWKYNIDAQLKTGYYPHIIVVEIHDGPNETAGHSGIIRDKQPEFTIDGNKYVLDSCVIRDKSQQHFCSLITCEGKQYGYDGMSYHRLVHLNWKNHINTDFTWTFDGTYDSDGEKPLEWSFLHGYQMLIYYLS